MKYYWHLVMQALQRSYDAHLEKAQMRLAPVRPPRSWRDIPHASVGCHHG